VRSDGRVVAVTIRWFRRRWEESRGDEFDCWGSATYYFEVDADGLPIRQVEQYDNGPTLRYGPDHLEDQYGGLSTSRLEEIEDWTRYAVTSETFEESWSRTE
jgi:hypothetical protein